MTAVADDIAAKSKALTQDAEMAASKGASPEQQAARRRVVELFCSMHVPETTPGQTEAYLATIDLEQPVQVVNASGVDTNVPATRGLFGMGRKPQYLLSKALPPKKPEDPIYALKSFPART